MINKIVLGVTAKEFKEQNGIDKSVNSIRSYLNEEQIRSIETLQRFDIGLITMIDDYQERKAMLTNYYIRLNQRNLIA